MSKVSNALPLTVPFDIPAYWTPEQAFAVVELLDDLRDRIWAHYGVQLLDQYREQYGPADSDHTRSNRQSVALNRHAVNQSRGRNGPFIFTSASCAVYARIHAAGNTADREPVPRLILVLSCLTGAGNTYSRRQRITMCG
jgi:hypothetical protein